MLLSKRTILKLDRSQKQILDCLGHAASKLWNIGNYEKRNYKELGFSKYPDWYDQKKHLKDEFWYKALPSQSAQEVLNQLEQAWKSFFTLVKTGGVENPQPPHFRKKSTQVSFLKDAIQKDGCILRLSLPKQLKLYLLTQGIDANYLYLKNKAFSDIETIKQVKISPCKDENCEITIIYQIEDIPVLPNNGRYLAIDLGLNNLATCYDNAGKGFIISGSRYLNVNYYYNKEIARLQEIYDRQQTAAGVKYPVKSEKVLRLYEKKHNAINDLMHKATRQIADYCYDNDIHTVIIGDIKNIHKNKNLGTKVNQIFHALPYRQFYQKLEYKLALYGIIMIKQKESWSSQCSPESAGVNKRFAIPSNRRYRGLYVDGRNIYNADMVGAYNILRLYKQKTGLPISFINKGIDNPIKVSA